MFAPACKFFETPGIFKDRRRRRDANYGWRLARCPDNAQTKNWKHDYRERQRRNKCTSSNHLRLLNVDSGDCCNESLRGEKSFPESRVSGPPASSWISGITISG